MSEHPTTKQPEFGLKFDYKLHNNHSFAARYIFGDSLQSGPPFAGLPAGGSNNADLFNSFAPSRAQMAGVSWTWNVSNNKILESRLGFTRFSQLLGVNNHVNPADLGIETGPLSPADFGVPYVYLYHLGYGGYIGGAKLPISTRPDQHGIGLNTFMGEGNHTIKFGGNFQRIPTVFGQARTGLLQATLRTMQGISRIPARRLILLLFLMLQLFSSVKLTTLSFGAPSPHHSN